MQGLIQRTSAEPGILAFGKLLGVPAVQAGLSLATDE
jgi:hypothetical protein